MAQLRFPPVRSLPEPRYVRAPEPLDFPEEALMPESKTHLVLRTFLFRLLRFALGPAHRVGSEQFLLLPITRERGGMTSRRDQRGAHRPAPGCTDHMAARSRPIA
jgi:hypothetical protein